MPPRLLLLLSLLALVPAMMWAQSSPPPATDWTKRFDQAKEQMQTGKVEESLSLGRETVALAEQQFGAHDPGMTTTARYELAQLYLRCHRFPEAEKCLTEVVAAREQAHGPDDLRVGEALYDLAWFYSNMSSYAKAEPLFLRVLAIDEKQVGRRHPRTALALNSLGVLNENKGNYTAAENYFLEAIAIQKETLGPDTATTATTLNNLATLYWVRGDYQQAEHYFSQALAIRERVKGRGSLATATTVNNLALVYLGMGDYERAETLFWRVLRIREQKLGVNHPLTLTSVNHLGLLYYDLGDYTAAESFLQRAAQSREKVIGADQPDTARSFFHLAYLYDTLGQYGRAEPLHQRALDIRRRILGEPHPETAASYGFLARHYHLSGQLALAAPLYEQALTIQRAALGPYHPDLLKTLENSACLQLELGHRPEATALAREASTVREHLLQNLFLFTSEKQRIDFQRTLRFYNLTATLGDATEIARVVYRTKGVVLDSILEDKLAEARASDNPEIAALLARLQATAHTLEKNPTATEREPLEREIDRLQGQLGEKMGRAQSSRRALQVEPATIAAAIPEHAALIEFVRYQTCGKNLTFQPAYGAVVQRRNQPPRWIELGNAETIDASIQLYQKYVRRRVRDTALRAVLQQLEQRLWQPLESALGSDCQRMILSPDSALNSISFATLLSPDDRFLAERYTFEYVTSARDLLRTSTAIQESDRRLVLFSAPDFGPAKSTGTVSDAIRLSPLPGAQREAALLQSTAKESGLEVESYSGTQATEAKLKAIGSPRILHLATHGLAWATTKPVTANPIPGVTTRAAHSGSTSLLALAGAQATLNAWQRGEFPTPEKDGVITASEVGTLNLHHTWLVVLSACDTGTGPIQAGEGVLGLRRGFLLAGAQNLVMTLWPVDDAYAATFMQAFYRNAFNLHQVQRDQLVTTRKEKGLWQAVRSAGPYILCN
ncbi:MAG: hypothetical protein B9S32_02975 [Verrucomicrobia bacterium Tous-C9LFEB]|nr:MAG: hypothetical protein B9S32_02975 [Verrucomicrobia bacterium Tous-C9LFEB]